MSAEGGLTLPVEGVRSLRGWRNAVLIAFALGGLTMATWGPRMPSIRADLGLDNAGIGIVLSGVTVGSIVGLVASSALLSWLGSRAAIRTMLWLIAAGVAAIAVGAGLLHSVIFTAVAFAILGFGIGSLDVMINVDGAAVERAIGKTLMPLMHAGWSAGAVVGAGLGALCALVDLDYQWQFLGEAVIIAIGITIAARYLPARLADDVPDDRPPLKDRVIGWLKGWTQLRLLLIGLVMLGVELGEGSANNWLTLAVRDGHDKTDAVAAAFFTVFAIGETAARVFGGPLVDRIGRVMTIRLTTALGILGLLFFILGDHAWLILIGVVLWAVGVSMGFPLGMSAAADSGPNPAARVSVVASIGYVANLAGPPVVGFLSRSFGLLDALWLIVILLAVGFAAAGSLRTAR
ncbi:MFS transporter [Microlunatus elymi]|nr:MFS transporter [Microlunatus elymi]